MNKHKNHFIALAVLIFVLVGIGHTLRVIYDWRLIVGSYAIPLHVSILAIITLALMIVMGIYYLRGDR